MSEQLNKKKLGQKRVISVNFEHHRFNVVGFDLLVVANSDRLLVDLNKMSPEKGQALFMIEKRPQAESFVVNVKFSTIGVKGTEFLVSQGQKVNQVVLTEGLVSIYPVVKEFELFLKKELSAFEQYRKQQESSFNSMKESLEAEFEAFHKSGKDYVSQGRVSSAGLSPGQTITVSKDKAILAKQQSELSLEKIRALKSFRG